MQFAKGKTNCVKHEEEFFTFLKNTDNLMFMFYLSREVFFPSCLVSLLSHIFTWARPLTNPLNGFPQNLLQGWGIDKGRFN